jgi:hypothetical protein
MGLLGDILRSPLLDLVLDQRLAELVKKGEIRVTEESLQREILRRQIPSVVDPAVTVTDGRLTITGRVRMPYLPFLLPFSVSLSVHSLESGPSARIVNLRVEEMRPFNCDWINGRIARSIPSLAYRDGVVTLDMVAIPAVERFFAAEVKGFRLFDHIVLDELLFRKREIVGRIGVCR